jgi:hypothetical protein
MRALRHLVHWVIKDRVVLIGAAEFREAYVVGDESLHIDRFVMHCDTEVSRTLRFCDSGVQCVALGGQAPTLFTSTKSGGRIFAATDAARICTAPCAGNTNAADLGGLTRIALPVHPNYRLQGALIHSSLQRRTPCP